MDALFGPTYPTESVPSREPASMVEQPGRLALKRLVWLYFWLLLFEGALRKWILPGFSNPLLLVRDPVAILIYVAAITAGVFPRHTLVGFTIGLGLLSIIVSEVCGTGNLLVTLYGFRTSFLHLPLIFVLPAALDRRDVEKMAKYALVVMIPMLLLVVAQFQAPPDAWVNRGAGGGVGAQLTVGFGKIRPPGTFSFTSGLVSYLGAAVAIAIWSQMKPTTIKPRVAQLAMVCLAAIVLVSGSRSALGGVFLVLIAVVFACAQKPKLAGQGIRLIVFGGVVCLALSSLSEFRTGLTIHQSRIGGGGGLHDGILMRMVSTMLEPLSAAGDAPLFGVGLGMGTNGATGYMNGGEVTFKLGEGDLGRTIREMGAFLGFLHIGLRLGIVVFLARRAYDSLQRENPLPLLLFASCFHELLYGQTGVPTMLGLMVFKGGLALAATNLDTVTEPATQPEFAPEQPLAPVPVLRGFRGRSAYAEQLHGEVENPVTQRFGP